MSNIISVKIKPELVETLKQYIEKKVSMNLNTNELKRSLNVNKINLEIINKIILEKYTEKKDRIAIFFKENEILKEMLSSTVLISIMQIIMFMVFASFGVVPPMYMDFIGIKLSIYLSISVTGFFLKKYLFPEKNDIKRGLIASFFFSSIYQFNGLLIY